MVMSETAQTRAEELANFLSRLPHERLIAICADAVLKHNGDPVDAISSLTQLAGAIANACNETRQLALVDYFRTMADQLEHPVIQARIERSRN
jgi:hypothetical protein